MELSVVTVDKPEDQNVIIGQAHFIKTVEDLHEAVVGTVPGIEFGLAFCEASGPCLIRHTGNAEDLVALAVRNAESIAAGHVWVLFVRHAYPINILNALKLVPEVCGIYCATANPVELVVAETDLGRGVLGVIDGLPPAGVESAEDQAARRGLLRAIGYKL